LKFLEFIEKYYPNKLATLFDQELFVYANVPYKIKSYADTLANPKDTIIFDEELDLQISEKRAQLGADGALLTDNLSSIYKVNLIEKLLATVLAKVSNFIPEAGIWMNTQRPEWNDANNALVGNGVSMVTLCYLRRFLNFFEGVVKNSENESNVVSEELAEFFERTQETLVNSLNVLSANISDKDRKSILDGLGNAASDYRTKVYANGFTSNKKRISKEALLSFLATTKQHLDHTIDANKREDNLYHSYNIMTLENEKEVSISNLPEMLEGQVAVLSSGYISSQDSLKVLDALKGSALFREDQYSYILYPNKQLSRFSKKNNIPNIKVLESELLQQLLADGNSQIMEKDILGNYHFNGNFNNAESLKTALTKLPQEKYEALISKDQQLLLNTFEEIFDHKSFTGRSGTFFGYEGLGSIYWHMVSKLVLSIQESCLTAVKNKEDDAIIGKLFDHYYEASEGIGIHKSPELYGAFPTDAYSHTPGGKGAQQPGMTGQVKEDILSRFGELGVFVSNGEIGFHPSLLRKGEFLKEPKTFKYTDIDNSVLELELGKDSLCFTYCQIPVVYKLSQTEKLQVHFENGKIEETNKLFISKKISKQIFERTTEVRQITVSISKK